MSAPTRVGAAAWQMLQDWLPGNDEPDRPQMQLATVDADGSPDVRTLLLSEFGPDGFWFHTDSRSRKVTQLGAASRVALLFLWPGFTRQLSVQGVAELAQAEEIAAAFTRRSPHLQQLAWQNTDEFAVLAQQERIERWQALAAAHPDGFAQPPTWTGYLVRPTRLTFWEGSTETASRRIEFTATPGGDWRTTLLAG